MKLINMIFVIVIKIYSIMKKLIIFFCICSFICACQIVDMPYEKDVNYSNQSPKIDKNWGWGGLYDGWYFGDSVIAGQYNFSSFRSDIIDIYPTE